MPSAIMDVPLNGVGLESDLQTYGFIKTFVASGSDQFDALIEVNTGVGFIPVGRLKGQSTVSVHAWGYNFRLNRIDDGANTSPVLVSVQAPLSAEPFVAIPPADLTEGGIDLEVDLGAAMEPITVTVNCNVQCDVLVLGRVGLADEAPLARLGQNEYATINNGVDVSKLVFHLVSIADPNEAANCRCWGKSGLDPINTFAEGKIQLVSGGGGGSVLYQTIKAASRFSGVVTEVGVGQFDVYFNDNLPNNTPLVYCNVSPAVGAVPERYTVKVAGDAIAANAIRLEVLDAAGVHVEPNQINVYVKVDF